MGRNRSPLVNVFSTKDLASVAGGARVRPIARCASRRERANLDHSRTRIQSVGVAGADGSVQICTVLVYVSKLSPDGSMTGGNAELDPFLVPRRFILWVVTVARW